MFKTVSTFVYYGRKSSIFCEKNSNLTKNNTLNNVFCNQNYSLLSLLTNFLKNDWILINHGLFLGENIFYNSTVSEFENK